MLEYRIIPVPRNPIGSCKRLFLCMAIVIIGAFGRGYAANMIDITINSGDTIWVDSASTFDIWLENDNTLGAFSTGFKIWSDDGTTWSWGGGVDVVTVVESSRMDPHTDIWDLGEGIEVTEQDLDGVSPDSIMIGGVALYSSGLPTGALEHMFSLHFYAGGPQAEQVFTFCIDSAFIPPYGDFVFSDFGSAAAITPSIGWVEGGQCWPVKNQSNEPPEIIDCPGSVQYYNHCNVFSTSLQADDPESDFVEWTIYTDGDGTALIGSSNPSEAIIDYHLHLNDVGEIVTLTIFANDQINHEIPGFECQMQIEATNEPPIVTCGEDVYIEAGNEVIATDIEVIDFDPCDPYLLSVISGPGYFDGDTYRWQTGPDDHIGSPYEITIEADDGFETDTCDFEIHVIEAGCCNTPGDANNDGNCNIGDQVFINNFVFRPHYPIEECSNIPKPLGCAPDCMAEGDANASGSINIGDAVYIGNFIFVPDLCPIDPPRGCPPECGPEK